jgi:hypothetical protein
MPTARVAALEGPSVLPDVVWVLLLLLLVALAALAAILMTRWTLHK